MHKVTREMESVCLMIGVLAAVSNLIIIIDEPAVTDRYHKFLVLLWISIRQILSFFAAQWTSELAYLYWQKRSFKEVHAGAVHSTAFCAALALRFTFVPPTSLVGILQSFFYACFQAFGDGEVFLCLVRALGPVFQEETYQNFTIVGVCFILHQQVGDASAWAVAALTILKILTVVSAIVLFVRELRLSKITDDAITIRLVVLYIAYYAKSIMRSDKSTMGNILSVMFVVFRSTLAAHAGKRLIRGPKYYHMGQDEHVAHYISIGIALHWLYLVQSADIYESGFIVYMLVITLKVFMYGTGAGIIAGVSSYFVGPLRRRELTIQIPLLERIGRAFF